MALLLLPLLLLIGGLPRLADARAVNSYCFTNSLRDCAAGPPGPLPPNEPSTKVPVWLGRMCAAAPGNSLTAAGQFGFVDGWVTQINNNGGPSAQLGYDNLGVPLPAGLLENTWNGWGGITDVTMVPGNFFEWQPASNRVGFYTSLIDLVTNNGGTGKNFWLYFGWPPFDAFLNGGNWPSAVGPTQYRQWREYALGAYAQWGQDLLDGINAARPTLNPVVRLVPVNSILVMALNNTALSALSAQDLFVDDAPHGGQTIYLLASMINYMALYNEQPPASSAWTIDPQVHPELRNNYATISQYMWDLLQGQPGNPTSSGTLSGTSSPTSPSSGMSSSSPTSALGTSSSSGTSSSGLSTSSSSTTDDASLASAAGVTVCSCATVLATLFISYF